jgi:hypothetical protein
MLTVLCVLKESGGYTKDYVHRLHNMVRRNLQVEHRIICLTDGLSDIQHGIKYNSASYFDRHYNIQWEPLLYDWPGWWAKAEIFRPDLEKYGRLFYIDLSVVIVGDITEMATHDGLAVNKDFYLGCPSQSVLSLPPGALRVVWDTFKADPEKWMAEGDKCNAPNFGDQILLNEIDVGEIPYFQDLFPGQIVSARRDCNRGLPKNARIVKFHGQPKPHTQDSLEWVSQHWR